MMLVQEGEIHETDKGLMHYTVFTVLAGNPTNQSYDRMREYRVLDTLPVLLPVALHGPRGDQKWRTRLGMLMVRANGLCNAHYQQKKHEEKKVTQRVLE